MILNCDTYLITGFTKQPHVFHLYKHTYVCTPTHMEPTCACTRTHTFPAEDQSAESIHTLVSGMQALVLLAEGLSGEMLLVGPNRAANQLRACCYTDVGGAPAVGTGSP